VFKKKMILFEQHNKKKKNSII